jgi:hypothetical protein
MRTSIKILITICCFFILVGGGAITFALLSTNSDNRPISPPSLCSNFTCPADMVKDSSKVNGNTAQECCKAGSCADFNCVFPRVKKDSPGPGFSDETCCKDPPPGAPINCDAHTCSGNTLKKAGVGNNRCVRAGTVSSSSLQPCSSVCCEPPLCSDSFTCVAPRSAISGARGTTDSECCKDAEKPPGQPVQISSFSRNPGDFQGAYMLAENDEEFEKIQVGDTIRSSNGRLVGSTGKVSMKFSRGREIRDPSIGSGLFIVSNVVFLEGYRNSSTLSQWPENMPANSGPYTVFVA